MADIGLDIQFNGEIFRKDNPIIIAMNRPQAILRPVRLVYRSGGFKAGRVLGQYTSVSPNSTFFDNYDDTASGASSGLAVAKCVLFQEVSFDGATGGTGMGVGIFGGVVFEDKLLGIDDNGKTDLGAQSWSDAAGINFMRF